MCSSCWVEQGCRVDWNPAVAEVVDMIRRLYDDGPDGFGEMVGGPLHVELDDWNLHDAVIEPYYSGDEPPELVAHCDALAAKLTALSVNERYSAKAHEDGLARDGVALWSPEIGWLAQPA